MGGVRGAAMIVTGQWEEGLEQGHGQCVTADGAAYDGQWEAGIRYARCCLQPNLALALALALAHALAHAYAAALAYAPALANAPALAPTLALAAANFLTQDQPRSCNVSLQAPHDITSAAQIEHIQRSHLHIW